MTILPCLVWRRWRGGSALVLPFPSRTEERPASFIIVIAHQFRSNKVKSGKRYQSSWVRAQRVDASKQSTADCRLNDKLSQQGKSRCRNGWSAKSRVTSRWMLHSTDSSLALLLPASLLQRIVCSIIWHLSRTQQLGANFSG